MKLTEVVRVLTLILIVSLTLFVIGCAGEELFTPSEGTTSIAPAQISWMIPLEKGKIKRNEIVVYSESVIGDNSFPGYRVSGNFWDSRSDLPIDVTKAKIGNIEIPINEGLLFYGISSFNDPDGLELLKSYVGSSIKVSLADVDGEFVAFDMNIAPPLRSAIVQNGSNPMLETKISKSSDLTFTWPVERIVEIQSGEVYQESVGAMMVYQPVISRAMDGNEELPEESVSVHKSVLLSAGELSFSPEDLASLPSNGMVTVYIGRARYKVDENGELISAPRSRTVRTKNSGHDSGGDPDQFNDSDGTTNISGNIETGGLLQVVN